MAGVGSVSIGSSCCVGAGGGGGEGEGEGEGEEGGRAVLLSRSRAALWWGSLKRERYNVGGKVKYIRGGENLKECIIPRNIHTHVPCDLGC